jgi:uncharacterized protein
MIRRRDFLTCMSVGTAAAAVPLWASARTSSKSSGRALENDSPPNGLHDPAFRPLPLTSIRPEGWLRRQLRIQADGLTGHLDEFWPDVARSRWFGGDADGWERAPYWMDGAIPLAWLLDDAPLKTRLQGYVEHILAHQREDGWFEPFPEDWRNPRDGRPYDLWAIQLADKVLGQYAEITGDERVWAAVEKNLKAMNALIDHQPLFNWGRFRWFEALIPIFALYERTGAAWLLNLARKLHDQGFDYPAFYRGEDVTVPNPRRGLWKWTKHVVNTGMAAKAQALWWRASGRAEDRRFPYAMLELLDRYHGQTTGVFTGDECLAGKNPIQGTELCAVLEFMYSLEHILAAFGDPVFGDRLEKVAFNALPATFSPDMWAHQYDQQANQVQCTINPDHLFTTNGPESNIYGLEPNFGCCTANMHQGWPKFAAHLWMRGPAGELVAAAYAPSTVAFEAGGVPVAVTCDTDYPFRDTLRFKVRAERPARFPLLFRIPAWAEGAVLEGVGIKTEHPKPGGFHRLDREWTGTTELSLVLPMRPVVTRRYNDAVAVERGPLVYALRIGEKWTRVNEDKPHREPPHADWEVRPETPWNYGLLVDEKNPEKSLRFEERPVGERPFSPEGAGMAAWAKGRKLPDWRLLHGWAGEIVPGDRESSEPLEDIELIPYGCTNIRITEFPRLKG